MERRDWSLKALSELYYIDSLDSYERADALVSWYNTYLSTNKVSDFDLEMKELEQLSELFYKNIKFLKTHKEITKDDLEKTKRLKKFVKNK